MRFRFGDIELGASHLNRVKWSMRSKLLTSTAVWVQRTHAHCMQRRSEFGTSGLRRTWFEHSQSALEGLGHVLLPKALPPSR